MCNLPCALAYFRHHVNCSQAESANTGSTKGAKGTTALDNLCDDLRRVRAESHPDLEDHSVLTADSDDQCYRMLGLCKGRTEFSPSNYLSWAADGSLCANAASM